VLSSQLRRCTCVGLIEGRINSWLVVGTRHCTQVQLRKTDVQARVPMIGRTGGLVCGMVQPVTAMLNVWLAHA
jgi:hypothetical protein